MRVYEAILKGVQSVGTDAASGGADQKTASPVLKHSNKTHIYVPDRLTPKCLSKNGRDRRIAVPDPTEIARVVGATVDVPRLVGYDPIGSNDCRSVAPVSRTNRNRTTFVRGVYPLANILMMFFVWGVSHA